MVDEKKIRKVYGSFVCTALMGLGAFAVFVGVALLVFAATSYGGWDSAYNVSRKAIGIYAISGGLSALALGDILWNLCEITITLRRIMVMLDEKGKE